MKHGSSVTGEHATTANGSDPLPGGTLAHVHEQDAVAARRSAGRSRLRSRFAAALVGLAALVGVGAVSAPQVSAATNATITACVQTTTYALGYPVRGKYVGPVYVDAYVSGSWHHVSTNRTSPYNGCVTQIIPPGAFRNYWRISVQYRSGGVWYAGASRSAYVTGGYGYNLGTFWV